MWEWGEKAKERRELRNRRWGLRIPARSVWFEEDAEREDKRKDARKRRNRPQTRWWCVCHKDQSQFGHPPPTIRFPLVLDNSSWGSRFLWRRVSDFTTTSLSGYNESKSHQILLPYKNLSSTHSQISKPQILLPTFHRLHRVPASYFFFFSWLF